MVFVLIRSLFIGSPAGVGTRPRRRGATLIRKGPGGSHGRPAPHSLTPDKGCEAEGNLCSKRIIIVLFLHCFPKSVCLRFLPPKAWKMFSLVLLQGNK